MKPRPIVDEGLLADDDPLWYQDAILYELHVKAFQDSNGDGVGDFRGVVERLDYLQDLGVTGLWVLPFFPSPLRDDGYDIADYTGVHAAYGNLDDFRLLLAEAHKRGLRVITELVMNHTSDQHPWFQRARRAPAGSAERDWYIWSDTPEKFRDVRIIFKDFETSNWTWDPVARAYFWHRFYSHQPDLNFDNPAVQQAMLDIVDFWLAMGVDGLRLDAVPYLFEREGTSCENLPETHGFLRRLRAHVDEKFRGRMLLAEANQWPEDAVAYFGNDDECHMAFHFPLMPRLYMALQREDRFDIIDVLEQTPPIPPRSQWAIFLRNHDELTLEMVTDEERDDMYRAFARDPQARINLGIRRRLAPLLENHRGKFELLNGLLLSLPGTPVLYYGDEIGMGDNIYLGDRNGVRTPMQWSPDRNAGFSRANPQRLYSPVVIDPAYHYEYVNAEAQQHNPHSLLWWMKHQLALRKKFRAFGRGSIEFLLPENPKILAFLRRYQEECLLVVANLSRFPQFAELDLGRFAGLTPVEATGQSGFPVIGTGAYRLTLGPHALHWFSLEKHPAARPAGEQGAALPTLTVSRSWQSVFQGRPARALADVLARYLSHTPWLADQPAVLSAAVRERVVVGADDHTVHVCLVQVEPVEGEPRTFVLPLAFSDGERAENVLLNRAPTAVARVEVRGEGGVAGVLHDAMAEAVLRDQWLAALAGGGRFAGQYGEIVARLEAGGVPADVLPPSAAAAVVVRNEVWDTLIALDDRTVLKALRQVEAGPNAEAEILRALQERTDYRHAPHLAGTIEYRPAAGEPTTLALLLQLPGHGQSAWSATVDALGRYCEHVLARSGQAPGQPAGQPLSWGERLDATLPVLVQETLGPELPTFVLLGQRLAEMHAALAGLADADFAPESFTQGDQRSLYQTARTDCRRACDRLRKQLAVLGDGLLPLAKEVIALEPAVLGRLRHVLDGRLVAQRQRVHGNLHLQRILWTGKDFVLGGPGGEPGWSLPERRRKRSPVYDVASLLRSFTQAARAAARMGHIRPVDLPALRPWLNLWQEGASLALVRSYLEAARPHAFLPDRDTSARLLDFFLLQHAMNELHEAVGQGEDHLRAVLEETRGMVATAAE